MRTKDATDTVGVCFPVEEKAALREDRGKRLEQEDWEPAAGEGHITEVLREYFATRKEMGRCQGWPFDYIPSTLEKGNYR